MNCGNCKYFVRYYLKDHNGIKRLRCGTCGITKYVKRTLYYIDGFCNRWQAAEPYPTKKKTEEILKGIYEKLEELTELLKDDI